MTERPRLSHRTSVADCDALLPIQGRLVAPDLSLSDALAHAVQQPQTRVLGVVDADGRLVGIVPIVRLAEALVARVLPEPLLGDLTEEVDRRRLMGAVRARTVGDLVQSPATVTANARVLDAFRVLHERRLSGLYAVDADGRPVGYLDLLELAVLVG